VLTDLPSEGLRVARKRAEREQVIFSGVVVASARDLPFTESSFDAIVHTDVLC
jgi:ubiquinone/menaquinone biosynthesis C-methylase UbiE